MSAEPVVQVRGLRVEAPSGADIVEDVSFSLSAGEILGIVGESGSGKTTTALAMLGYADRGARFTGGQVLVGGRDLLAEDERAARALRGKLVSYVPQEPNTALNPSMRIGDAVAEMLRTHGTGASPEASVAAVLEKVDLPGEPHFTTRYPHQLSGGQQQRTCISVAIACEPPIIVLDEPTTGLDVVTQASVLRELLRLRETLGVAMVYVTHDLAVIAQVADRIAVMYAGRIVESGPTEEVLRRPTHPYTCGLVAATPDHLRPAVLTPIAGVAVGVGNRPTGCAFAPRCSLSVPECLADVPDLQRVRDGHEVRCVRSSDVPLPVRSPVPARTQLAESDPEVLCVSRLQCVHTGRRTAVVTVDDVSFVLRRDHCLALVGESGSGKTTIARAIVGLHPASAGEITLGGERLAPSARKRKREQCRRVQIVQQDPAQALNPRMSVRKEIGQAARLSTQLSAGEVDAEVDRLLDLVRLPHHIADLYPTELSGGERQRVAIARALAARPDVLVCDEITSALDVSVQAAVLELLQDLREELGLGLLFITHDLGVVAAIADEVVVLESGRVCESGPVASVLREPTHEYTRRLLAEAPSISGALDAWHEHRAG